MKPLTLEWVAKAEGDFRTAEREFRAPQQPNFDGVCFHAQQCVEKYLKAVLTERGVAFPKIHDLTALLRLLLPLAPAWQAYQPECGALTDSAIEVRYPGFSAGESEARDALATAKRLRRAARQALGMPEA